MMSMMRLLLGLPALHSTAAPSTISRTPRRTVCMCTQHKNSCKISAPLLQHLH